MNVNTIANIMVIILFIACVFKAIYDVVVPAIKKELDFGGLADE